MELLTFEDFHNSLKSALNWNEDRDLNEAQLNAVAHGVGPLMIMAGPGSGKSEVIVWRCLKLLLVDCVDPKSIIVTTFTEKAARNLINRITNYITLIRTHLELDIREIPDASLIYIGTLHSLCNEIMQEYRYIPYQNKRLMDDFEQRFFVYRYCRVSNRWDGRRRPGPSQEFWNHFGITRHHMKWDRVNGAISILNRIIEDNVNIDLLDEEVENNEIFQELMTYYREYETQLQENYRCDFSHLQRFFLDFLDSEQGVLFLNGDNTRGKPPIEYILVDEYQDTNPIQESIYFRLAERTTNLTVVGDDDQAMYRFRGASTDAIVNFNDRCEANLGVAPEIFQLITNYRSPQRIIDLFNDYVFYYENYNRPGVRAPKERMVSGLNFENEWDPILFIRGQNGTNLAELTVDIIQDIINRDYVEDLSQIVLLFSSTREGPRGTGLFVEQLNTRGIPYFNPRSRMVQQSVEVQQILGALIEFLDPSDEENPEGQYVNHQLPGMGLRSVLLEFINNCRAAYRELDTAIDLHNAIQRSLENIRELNHDVFVRGLNIMNIFYRIVNLPPFSQYLDDPRISPRIGILSQLLEAFTSTNYARLITSSASSSRNGFVFKRNIIGNFYVPFCELLISQGINDFEDREFPIPLGSVQIMTYHQAKGLEFPFVFLLHLTNNPRTSSEHVLEEVFNDFRENPITLHNRDERAFHDYFRKIYVGKSRAQLGVILCFNSRPNLSAIGFDQDSNPLNDIRRLRRSFNMYERRS